jgi:hypothetical protein
MPFGGPNLQVRPQRADLKVRPSNGLSVYLTRKSCVVV